MLSIAEVAFAQVEQEQKKLDPIIEGRIQKLWDAGSPIHVVEFFELIAKKARTLMRKSLESGWSLRPFDAVHLATADHLKVKEFHTYDDRLGKFAAITETHFPIIRPAAKQPSIALPPIPPEIIAPAVTSISLRE